LEIASGRDMVDLRRLVHDGPFSQAQIREMMLAGSAEVPRGGPSSGRRVPIILNQLGPEFGRALRARIVGAAVTDDFDPNLPWETRAGVDVLITKPESGWTNAPREAPPDWTRDLRWIQVASAGVDFYPTWLVATDGPLVSCARGVTAAPIAEYVFAAILGFEKRLDAIAIRSPEAFRQIELGVLEERMIGMFGFGAIGQAIAVRARAFGMRIVATRRSPAPGAEEGVRFVEDLGTLVGECDYLVLAAPLTAETRHALDSRVLSRARPGLFVVNPARGGLIDQEALLAALDDGRVAGAVLDVTDPEPLPENHPLYRHPKVRITPHISWRSPLNARKLLDRVASNLEAYIDGRPLSGIVDPVKRY
jgi:phosphoglycerate dehydrogenase-like enzyme